MRASRLTADVEVAVSGRPNCAHLGRPRVEGALENTQLILLNQRARTIQARLCRHDPRVRASRSRATRASALLPTHWKAMSLRKSVSDVTGVFSSSKPRWLSRAWLGVTVPMAPRPGWSEFMHAQSNPSNHDCVFSHLERRCFNRFPGRLGLEFHRLLPEGIKPTAGTTRIGERPMSRAGDSLRAPILSTSGIAQSREQRVARRHAGPADGARVSEIEVIDDHLGRSAAGRVQRAGFERMVAEFASARPVRFAPAMSRASPATARLAAYSS